jgi:glycosyltransferase involved in cell wall biosynthesis
MFKKTMKKIFPPRTKRGRVVKKAAYHVGLAKPSYFDPKYQEWIDNVEPEIFLPVVKSKAKTKPLFSIVIPFFNTPSKYISPLIDSIVNQTFDDWELIIGDGSNDKESSREIQDIAQQDKRIKYYKFDKDTDISGNTNQALRHAVGEYIVFCDHDDVLNVNALNESASAIVKNLNIDIIYSDEDKISDDGKWRHNPLFKPDWSPHLFLYTNYTNHLSVIRRSLVEAAGGLRSEYNGSQDFDLLLRVHSLKDDINVHHIDKVLYYWREADGSAAADFSSKSYAIEAGKKALQQYLDRQSINGTTESIDGRPGFYRQVLMPNSIHKVKIYVAVSDDMAQNNAVIEKLKAYTKSDYLKYEFIPMLASQINNLKHTSETDMAIFEFRVVAYPKSIDWLDRLIGVLEMDDVAEVAPRIISSDNQKVVDMGIVYDRKGNDVRLHQGQMVYDMTLNGHTEWVRDVNKLTQSVVGYRAGGRKGNSKYSVVWSHVDFNAYSVFGKTSFFNSNLYVNKKKKILPNAR